MRYESIDKSLFTGNRNRLTQLLKPQSAVIVNANDIMPTSADGTMGFKQNPDLFHLTGVDQEETILVLCPQHPDPKFREVLFVRETNELIAIWEGEKLNKAQAREVSGIQSVYWTHQFNTIFPGIIFEAENVYLNTNEHTRNDSVVESRDARFIADFKQKYPLHTLSRLAPLMQYLRAVKQPGEIALLQKACDITGLGFRRLLQFVKPGVQEFEVEAELLHEFVRNRSKGFSYQPIIASGANACVLHYIQNDRTCQDGDVLLLDVAAEYANYGADLTRSIPINGRFTPRQRQVYDAVLRVFKAAKSMLVTGTLLDEYHLEVGKMMESELIGLGLITKEAIAGQDPDLPVYRKYFPHGTSHFLGLDIHDVGSKYRRLEPGMVLTCEPGIYIREEKLGIRLENDILITADGNFDLMANIPLEADEIETWMHEK